MDIGEWMLAEEQETLCHIEDSIRSGEFEMNTHTFAAFFEAAGMYASETLDPFFVGTPGQQLDYFDMQQRLKKWRQALQQAWKELQSVPSYVERYEEI